MPQELDELLRRIQAKHLGEPAPDQKSQPRKTATWRTTWGDRLGDALAAHKKLALAAILAVVAGLAAVFLLAGDYLTKRLDYPERHVLFRSASMIYVAGSSEVKGVSTADRMIESEVYEGGVESKVGTILFTAQREIRDEVEYFNLYNTQRVRVASATRKPEIVQAGLRIGGSINFREQFAEIILSPDAKAPQSYYTYKFVPERGAQEVEITIVREPDGASRLENRMIERRGFPLGWLYGKEFRAGTVLEAYAPTPANETRVQQLQDDIRILNSPQATERATRERMVKDAAQLSLDLDTTPIYATYEGGVFDLLPQGSTVYLAHAPTWLERGRDALLGVSPHARLRVNNFWNLFPGRYPLLRKIRFGQGENAVYPFDKYNNGGYTITDRYGDLARIEIQDFILFYGQNLVYAYYLDLNGDGKLDRDTERIGSVLCRATHDERLDLEKLVGEGRPKADVTFTMQYSFMSPVADLRLGRQYFELCAYIESLLPDQVNRGFGKHSLLGYINEQRSDILLFDDLSIENMSRALTQESTLVAKSDIVNVLIAAKRPYARQVAAAFGIADRFAGTFADSPLLKARRDWSMIIRIAVLALGLAAVVIVLKRGRA